MGMQLTHLVPQPSQAATQTTRELIHDPSFCWRHRTNQTCFTRHRMLTFMNVVTIILQKSVRSIHSRLQDFFEALTPESPTVTPPSWSEARLKLRHSAFVELNERAVLDVVYGKGSAFDVRRWKHHRLLAIDSSLIRLPQRDELGEEFGWVDCANQAGASGRYPQGRLSVLTDVLNRIAVQILFTPWQQGERDLAVEHVKRMEPEDLGLLDRGFASYELFAQFQAHQRWFVCRCPTSSFDIVNRLFRDNQEGRSVIVTLRPSSRAQAQIRRTGLPLEIRVRFVTVRLETGQLEVLATNLLDESKYPTHEFKELYHHRWGIETFYGLIKGRLDLENFTGVSAEAIRQDLYATIFLSNFETILIQPAQKQLSEQSQSLEHRQQVNHAVSFHAIKSRIIDLLLSSQPIPDVLPKLQQLFLGNPVSCRPKRQVPRLKRSAWRSYQYQRNTKKVVF